MKMMVFWLIFFYIYKDNENMCVSRMESHRLAKVNVKENENEKKCSQIVGMSV